MSVRASIRTSLIVTTYNQPVFLELLLKTALRQTRLPDEILVADDGSRDDTADVLRKIGADSPVPIVHLWQRDDGYRLNRSRNNAIAAASGDYLILMDGDCFLNPYFISDHLYFAKPGYYVTGTRVNLDARLKEKILKTGNTRVTFFTHGTHKKFNAIRCLPLALTLSGRRKTKPEKDPDAPPRFWVKGVSGANFAFWRGDALKVNGFNEAMTHYGGNDHEFATRLGKSGIAHYRMVHYGMAYHFMHGRPYITNWKERLNPVSEKYLETVEDQGRRCRPEFGLTRALDLVDNSEPRKGYVRYEF